MVPLHLICAGGVADGGQAPAATLVSRAEARRVAARLAQFRHVELDFTGIADIGHGFADELFRVFGLTHPSLALVPAGMAPRVAAMVRGVAT